MAICWSVTKTISNRIKAKESRDSDAAERVKKNKPANTTDPATTETWTGGWIRCSRIAMGASPAVPSLANDPIGCFGGRRKLEKGARRLGVRQLVRGDAERVGHKKPVQGGVARSLHQLGSNLLDHLRRRLAAAQAHVQMFEDANQIEQVRVLSHGVDDHSHGVLRDQRVGLRESGGHF